MIDYHAYINSDAWRLRRRVFVERANGACERCGDRGPFDVHHKHYDTLTMERHKDVEVLCRRCHIEADRERESRVAGNRWDARVDAWATKKYGEDWCAYRDPSDVEEEFEAWLERKHGQGAW